MARSVLVVDDNALNRDLLYEELTYRGMDVVTAAGGRDALELIRKQPFDIVLLDIMMPGVDGLSVLREVRKTRSVAELPIIMTTARDTRSSVVDALDAGANDYVTKPIDLLVLMARIRTQIALKDANDAATSANQRLEEAQQTILQLTSRGVSMGDVEGWTTSMARELSQVIGARVEVVLEDRQSVDAHIDAGEETRRLAIGAGASRFGELVVARSDWSDRERMLLESFARQLAAALEMRRLRSELTAARCCRSARFADAATTTRSRPAPSMMHRSTRPRSSPTASTSGTGSRSVWPRAEWPGCLRQWTRSWTAPWQ